MSVTYVNSEEERTAVRLACGNTGESNLGEADIDKALTAASEEVVERTGLLPNDTRLPHMRQKMKILLASSYLMIRFSNLLEVRANILKEIDSMTENMKVLEDASAGVGGDESLIEADETDNAEMNQINFWLRGTKRSVVGQGKGRNVFGYADDYIISRLGL